MKPEELDALINEVLSEDRSQRIRADITKDEHDELFKAGWDAGFLSCTYDKGQGGREAGEITGSAGVSWNLSPLKAQHAGRLQSKAWESFQKGFNGAIERYSKESIANQVQKNRAHRKNWELLP